MSKFNEILVGRFNNALKKGFGMKGPAPSPQLASEVAPTVGMFYGAENRFLEQWDRFGGNLGGVAVAAQNSAIRLRNPAGSNVIVIVEKLVVNENLADAIVLFNQIADADLASVNVNTRIDKRGRATSTAVLSAGNNVAGGLGVTRGFVIAGGSYDFITFEEQEIPVLPGDQLEARTVNVNVVLQSGWIWRERYLEESERF